MNILYYGRNGITEKCIIAALKKTGHNVVLCDTPCEHYTRDMSLAYQLIMTIHRGKIDAVFSYNYFPIISSVCETTGIVYYSWVYDSPHYPLLAKQAQLPCNRIFVFDRVLQGRLKELGFTQIHHMPLASDAEAFAKVIASSPVQVRRAYSCDVSFLGMLYVDEYDYYDTMAETANAGELINELDHTVASYSFCYGEAYSRLESDMLAADEKYGIFSDILEKANLGLGEDFVFEPIDIALPAVIEKKITVEERKNLVTALAAEDFKFRLYTTSDVSGYPENVRKCAHGRLDYHTQMPLLFAESKINLNVTLRSIRSGIPLRVMDIMGCGGFCLSNYQPEIEEYFKIGEETEVYHSLEECIEKIKYYLKHDEKRKRIARAGHEKVKNEFTYERLLGEILKY